MTQNKSTKYSLSTMTILIAEIHYPSYFILYTFNKCIYHIDLLRVIQSNKLIKIIITLYIILLRFLRIVWRKVKSFSQGYTEEHIFKIWIII